MAPGKYLVVLCDGTGKDEVDTSKLTNIAVLKLLLHNNAVGTLSRPAITKRTIDGQNQIVYYDRGVGTREENGLFSGFEDKVIGGATGKGINENVRQAYRFLCTNYEAGDKTFLSGFSRGAFTIRTLVGFIRLVGLLPARYANQDLDDKVEEAWELYEDRLEKGNDKKVKAFIKDYGSFMFGSKHQITCLLLFDTVKSLHSLRPMTDAVKRVWSDLFDKDDDPGRFAFHDTRVTDIVTNAYHALSADEVRKPFLPDVWFFLPGDKEPKDSAQVIFPGVHSDIGGGYPVSGKGANGNGRGLSDITLGWMLEKAVGLGLKFDLPTSVTMPLILAFDPNVDGFIHNSYTTYYKVLGKEVRGAKTFPPGTNTLAIVDDPWHDLYVSNTAVARANYKPGNVFLGGNKKKPVRPVFDVWQEGQEWDWQDSARPAKRQRRG